MNTKLLTFRDKNVRTRPSSSRSLSLILYFAAFLALNPLLSPLQAFNFVMEQHAYMTNNAAYSYTWSVGPYCQTNSGTVTGCSQKVDGAWRTVGGFVPGQVYFCQATAGAGNPFCTTGGWQVEFTNQSCYNIFINGVQTNYITLTNALYNSFTVSYQPVQFAFNWDNPKGGTKTVGFNTSITPYPTDGQTHTGITWQLVPTNALGCTINSTNGMVTTSTNAGSITVQFTDNGGNTCYTGQLDINQGSCACAAGSCANFSGKRVGMGWAGMSSVDMKVNLGWSALGGTAAHLGLRAVQTTNITATPQALLYNFMRPEVEVYTTTQGLYQVKAPEGLANMIVTNAYTYAIQLFSPTNIGSFTNGGYQLSGTPLRTICVSNPGNDTNQVQVSDTGDGSVYNYTYANNFWSLASGSGLRIDNQTNVLSLTNTIRTVTQSVQHGTDAPVYKSVQTFSENSYGERLIAQTNGTAANAPVSTYAYTTNGFLQQANYQNGSWQYNLYDASNRPTNIFSGFLNQGITTNSSLCRLTDLNYTTNVVSGSGDTGVYEPDRPRRTIQYVLGYEIGRSYFVALSGETHDIKCVKAGAAWNDAANLVTVTKLFTNGFHFNETQSVLHPNGTIDIYQYGPLGTNSTNIVLSGHPDATGTNIDQGTQTISVLGSTGQLLSQSMVDMASGITLSSETYQYDYLNRMTNTTYLDGTTLQETYDCCTLSSQQDRDGTLTTYSYDALKRLVTTTVNSITMSNTYNANDNLLMMVRYGTDGTAITNTTATYDNAGQLLSISDALGNATSYTNYIDGSSQQIKQTTFADGGTRIETYFADGSLKSISGTGVHPITYNYGADLTSTNLFKLEVHPDGGGGTNEWIKTLTDTAGRPFKTIYAGASGAPSRIFYYNAVGQMTNFVDPDGVSTLYAYNPKGELAYSVLDVNQNGSIDWSGADRITFTTNDVVVDNGANVKRTRTYAWATSANSSNLVSTTETSTDGLKTWSATWNNGIGVTTTNQTSYDVAHGYRVVTTGNPDGSSSTSTNQYGRLLSTTRKDATGSQISQTLNGYDAHGRLKTMADARTGTNTYTFNIADQIVTMVTPSPAETTTYYYDGKGRIVATTQPDGTSMTNVFYLSGELKLVYGSRTVPTGYSYDGQGRKSTMTNWSSFTGNTGVRVTAWSYDAYRGFLTGKTYDGGTAGPTYTYTDAGRVKTRLWARGTNTTYAYNGAGDLFSVVYNDGATAGLTNGYDRRGRKTAVTNSPAVCTLAYNDAGQVLSESYSGGPLNGLSLTNGCDSLLRRTNVVTLSGGTVLSMVTNNFDAASRLSLISDGTNSATYSYLANSPLVSQIVLKQSGTTRMTTSTAYDNLNRLTSIGSTNASSLGLDFHGYGYNSANQRTSVTNADGTFWAYTYDALGQVTSGKKYWSDGNVVAGQQFGYTFDDIGNRSTTQAGGSEFGADQRWANYTANTLNQYTSRIVPPAADVTGSATNASTVTINNQRTYRHGDYYRAELPISNASGPVFQSVTNLAVLNEGTNADIITNVTGSIFLPQSPESFTYDADGNLTQGGRWKYSWDAENRLVAMTNNANVPDAAKMTLNFAYDYRDRRISKVVSNYTSGSYQSAINNTFLYDGWNLVNELNASNGAPIRIYTWGSDWQGHKHNGSGGELLLTISSSGATRFTCYDGNDNISALIDVSNAAITAQYEYSMNGDIIHQTGVAATANPIRFSTKYEDTETDTIYYGKRYLDTKQGRWLSRDPSGESAGINLYVFVSNDSINKLDSIGLQEGSWYVPVTWNEVLPGSISGAETTGRATFAGAWDAGVVEADPLFSYPIYNPTQTGGYGYKVWAGIWPGTTIDVAYVPNTTDAMLMGTVEHEMQHVMMYLDMVSQWQSDTLSIRNYTFGSRDLAQSCLDCLNAKFQLDMDNTHLDNDVFDWAHDALNRADSYFVPVIRSDIADIGVDEIAVSQKCAKCIATSNNNTLK